LIGGGGGNELIGGGAIKDCENVFTVVAGGVTELAVAEEEMGPGVNDISRGKLKCGNGCINGSGVKAGKIAGRLPSFWDISHGRLCCTGCGGIKGNGDMNGSGVKAEV